MLLSVFVDFYRWPFYSHSSKILFIFALLCVIIFLLVIWSPFSFSRICYPRLSRLPCLSLSRFYFFSFSFLPLSFRYFWHSFSYPHFEFKKLLRCLFFSLLFLRFPSLSFKLPLHLEHYRLDPSASLVSSTFPFCHSFVLLSSLHFYFPLIFHFFHSSFPFLAIFHFHSSSCSSSSFSPILIFHQPCFIPFYFLSNFSSRLSSFLLPPRPPSPRCSPAPFPGPSHRVSPNEARGRVMR